LALLREQKEQLVKAYGDRLARSQVLIWSSYAGIGFSQFAALRDQLRAAGAEGVVVKNTLMRIALEQAGLPTDIEFMKGPNLVTFVYDNVASATKAVVDFSRMQQEAFAITGGLVGSRAADAEQIRSLTTLPSREVLLAQVLGGIQAPISGFVGTLAAVMRGLLNVLNARSEQLEGSSS